MNEGPIGVFDSGIGGISVLRNMARLLPKERFVYFGDDANAPYGTKTESEILTLAKQDAEFLLKKDAKCIVIACNTATSAAAAYFRKTLSVPVIGMEPALKPASFMRKEGKIAVLATPATLRQKKFRLLMEKYGEHALPVPCDGLMEFVEQGITDGEELQKYLLDVFSKLKDVSFDAAVLGCTHYVFLKKAIRRVLPFVPLVDGNEGTARQLERVLAEKDLLCERGEGGIELYTSGDSEKLLPLMRRLLLTEIE